MNIEDDMQNANEPIPVANGLAPGHRWVGGGFSARVGNYSKIPAVAYTREPIPVAQGFARYLWGPEMTSGFFMNATDGTVYVIVDDPVGIMDTKCLPKLDTSPVAPASKPTTTAFIHAIRAPKHQVVGLFVPWHKR